LIIQQFFNRLPQVGHLTTELWLLAALPVAIALARTVLYFVGAWIDPLHRTYMYGLLQRNLLERILERPGARPVPTSPGEALNHFRDDTREVENAISWAIDAIGMGMFAIVAIILLLRIDVLITLLVFAGRHCGHHSDDEKAFTSLPERQPPGNWTRHWFYR
jgi:ATP-binding cassette, subfamily B, bacterial